MTISLLDFGLLALVTFRLSCMLVLETGPWDVFVKFRRAIGVRYDEYSEVVADGMIAQLFTCPYCVSVWVGLVIACAFFWHREITIMATFPLSLSGASYILIRFAEGE